MQASEFNQALKQFQGIVLTPEAKLLLTVIVTRFIPEHVVLGGKIVNARTDALAMLEDGRLDVADLLAELARFAEAPPAPAGSGGGSPRPGTPSGSVARVTRIVARVSLFSPPRLQRAPVPFKLAFGLDAEQIVLDYPPDPTTGDRQTSLWRGSRLKLEADYFDQQGNPLRIDLDPAMTPAGQTNHPEFLGIFRFEAWSLDGKRLLGSIGGAGLDNNAHVEGPVHWLDPDPEKGPGAWRRSGGVYAECSLTEQCRVLIVNAADDEVYSNAFITPEIR